MLDRQIETNTQTGQADRQTDTLEVQVILEEPIAVALTKVHVRVMHNKEAVKNKQGQKTPAKTVVTLSLLVPTVICDLCLGHYNL